jgi:hypothetical protein
VAHVLVECAQVLAWALLLASLASCWAAEAHCRSPATGKAGARPGAGSTACSARSRWCSAANAAAALPPASAGCWSLASSPMQVYNGTLNWVA